MSYVDGMVCAVPTENKQAYVEHARKFSALLKEYGAANWLEAWGDDVPTGKVTDLSPKFPPVLGRVLGLMFGPMRPGFPVPVSLRTRGA
jgi:hypothetical protein